MKNQMAKTGLLLILVVSVFGCGDETAEPTGGDECPATGCACLTLADCPDPLVQVCGSTGVCVNRDTLEPDATDDSDASEPDATPDESTPDVTSDPTTDPDPADEDSDGTPDEEVVNTDADADVVSDPDVESDVDATPDEDAEDGSAVPDVVWVAYTVRAGNGSFSLHFIQSDGSERVAYETDDWSITSPAWSPDGSRIAVQAAETVVGSVIRILDFDGGEPQEIASTLITFSDLVWMPDGENLLIVGNKTSISSPDSVWMVNIESELVTAVTAPTDGESDNGPVPAPDGELIYFVRGGADSKEIWSVNPDNGDEHLVDGTPGTISAGLDISPDGSTLIWATLTGALQRHCVTGASCGRGGAGNTPAFFPDGLRVATAQDRVPFDIVIYDAERGELLFNLTDDDATNTNPAVSPVQASDIDVSFGSD